MSVCCSLHPEQTKPVSSRSSFRFLIFSLILSEWLFLFLFHLITDGVLFAPLLLDSLVSLAVYQRRDSPANDLHVVWQNVSAYLRWFPLFDEMETLQVLQVTVLSSFRMKYNQTLECFCLDAIFAAFWTKTMQCVCDVMMHLQWAEPISRFVKQAC